MDSPSAVDVVLGGVDGDTERSSASHSHVKVVLDFWKTFNLDGRRLQLDKQGLELQDAKDASLARRKKLAELTKEFRKKPDHDKVSGVQRLVKAYQEEIDALAKRCRSSDSAFFALYKSLYEAPDPAQALEKCLSERPRAAASKLEVQKLQAELADYEKEFSQLKNQDITIRRLEDTIAGYEQGTEARVQEEAEERLQRLQQEADSRVEAIIESKQELERSLKVSEDALAEARDATEEIQGRLFEASRSAQEAEAAWEVEREILSQASEAAQSQLARLEQETQEFRRRDREGASRSGDGDIRLTSAAEELGIGGRSEVEASSWTEPNLKHARAIEEELAELTRVNSQLRGEIMGKEVAWREEKDKLEAAVEAFKRSAAAQGAAADSLKKELSSRPTGEEVRALKQKLRVLQQLEFNAWGEENGEGIGYGDEPHGTDPEDTAGDAERTMEQIIRGRVRRLEAELTSLRRLADERGVENNRLQRSLDAALSLAADRLETANRLEEDLANVLQSVRHASGGATSSRGGRGMDGPSDGPEGAQALRELLGVGSFSDNGVWTGNAEGADIDGGAIAGEDRGVLGIVQAQRDRFRRRIKELEAEREDEEREARAAQGVLEGLKRDNVQLYEKVRFLQNYQRASSSTTEAMRTDYAQVDLEGGSSLAGRGSLGNVEGVNAAEDRYGKMYEARINPFTQFSQREQQRKYKELSVAEKITLSTTRMFLAHKSARHFVFFYVLFLHAVVFSTLNHWAHSNVGC